MRDAGIVDGRSFDSLADLLAIAALTVIVGLFVFVPPLNGTPLRPVVSLAFVLFVPGYTYVSVLFPKRGTVGALSNGAFTGERQGGLGMLERLVFSFGVSVGLTILLGLALGFWIPGITRLNLYAGLAGLTGVGLPLAATRRMRLPADARMGFSLRAVSDRIQSGLAGQETTGKVVTVVLAATLLVAVASVGAGLGASQDGAVTEMYLPSENDSGDYVPRDYPETVAEDGNESFALGITNQEGETVEYTVVVLLQQFDDGERDGPPVSETRLQTFSATLDDGETEQVPHSISPPVSGQRYRLTYLLYAGEPPSNPSIDTSYREVHLWIRVTDPAT